MSRRTVVIKPNEKFQLKVPTVQPTLPVSKFSTVPIETEPGLLPDSDNQPISVIDYNENKLIDPIRISVPPKIIVTDDLIRSLVPQPSPRPSPVGSSLSSQSSSYELEEPLPLESDLSTLSSVIDSAKSVIRSEETIFYHANFQSRIPFEKVPYPSSRPSPLPISNVRVTTSKSDDPTKDIPNVRIDKYRLHAGRSRESYTVKELKDFAAQLKLKILSTFKKEDYIKLLEPYAD